MSGEGGIGGLGPDQVEQMMEQGEAGLVGVAKLLGTYRRQLKAEGFNDDQVLELVKTLQMAYLGGPTAAAALKKAREEQ